MQNFIYYAYGSIHYYSACVGVAARGVLKWPVLFFRPCQKLALLQVTQDKTYLICIQCVHITLHFATFWDIVEGCLCLFVDNKLKHEVVVY